MQRIANLDTFHTIIVFDSLRYLDFEMLKQQPGVNVHFVTSGPDLDEQIDLKLLDGMHSCRTFVFIGGGEAAKKKAAGYNIAWINHTPSVNDDLVEFWRTALPEVDGP